MKRTDVFIKVELAVNDRKEVERIAGELCRMLQRAYGVRTVEVTNTVEKE